ncbi:DNA-directed RNA polymerase, partial [Tanacetum coccineum]
MLVAGLSWCFGLRIGENYAIFKMARNEVFGLVRKNHMGRGSEKDHSVEYQQSEDDYWTHPCNVDKMNIILRQKFVELEVEGEMDKLAMEEVGFQNCVSDPC